MAVLPQARSEQIAIQRLLANAYETLDKQLLSISGKVVLWGSIDSKDGLRDRYLLNKGKKSLLDRRRRLTLEEENEWIEVDNAASAAWDYLQWARNDSGQPIARESLVMYWSAFENCLKSVATAFLVATGREVRQIEGQIFVPLSALNAARRKIRDQWSSREFQLAPKGKLFFETAIVQRNCFPGRFKFTQLDVGIWDRIGAAYQARNAIVHSMGLATEQFDFGGRSLYPGDRVELEASVLRQVAKDFRTVLEPFRTDISIDDL